MRALTRKLLRDLWRLRTQAVAIALVVACGVATFVMSSSTLDSLRRTRDAYYDRTRFADVFARVERAPEALAQRMREIPGVAAVETRVVAEVTLTVPGLVEPATGRLVSLPDRGQPQLNLVHLRRGRMPESSRRGEVLATEAFAAAHGLAPGDEVSAVVNGRRERLEIVGVALSPEHVIQMRSGELLPDDRRFGVFFMPRTQLAAALDLDGAFNDLAVALLHGASEDEVLARIDELLARHGCVGAHGRSEHLSARFVDEELRQLRAMAVIAPSIFLGIAAFLLNVAVARLVSAQREQIATLQAFGYRRSEISAHYLSLTLCIALCGSAAGVAAGAWMGEGLTHQYTEVYRFPDFRHVLRADVVAQAVLLTIAAAVGGTVLAVRRAVSVPPAQALRPEPPAAHRRSLLERAGLSPVVPRIARIVLRNVERRPLRAALTVTGISLAGAVLVMGAFGEDSLDELIDFQFSRAQRQDVTVTLTENATSRALNELRHLPAVLDAEPFRVVPARLRFGARSRRVAVRAVAPDARLARTLDADGVEVRPPPDGLLLSEALADLLGAVPGDDVGVEVLEGEQRSFDLPLAGTVTEFAGLNAYVGSRTLERLMRESSVLSGAHLSVDPARAELLYRRLEQTPRVGGISVHAASLRSFRETIAENVGTMRAFNVAFAIVIAAAVVYNAARTTLAERARELATLRVLGFTRGEVAGVLLGEIGLLVLVSVPLGLAAGRLLALAVVRALETELYRFPVVIDRSTYAMAATVVLVSAAVSALVVRRHVDRLDLVAALKAPE